MFNLNSATVGNSQVRFEPNGFIAVQTGTYQAQGLRPFKSNTNEAVVSALRQATHDGLNLGVAAVQEIAADVIVPQAMCEGEVMIPHNFNSRRFRLMCRVNESHPFIKGTTTQRVFFGYSDHCDVALGGVELPDDMRIYFNSETIIQESIVPTPHGPQTQARIVGSNQIISPVNMVEGHNGMFSRPSNFLIRPEDNFNLMQTKAVAKNLQDNGLVDVKIDTSYDYRTMVGEGGSFKYSQRKDTSPVRYLSSSLGAYQHARAEYNDSMRDSDVLLFNKGNDPTEVLLGEAANMCRNHAIQSNTFLGILREHAGFMEKGYVTWKRLKELFPELRDKSVARFAMDDGRSQHKVSQSHQSQTFMGADHTSIAVSLLSQAIPSIMMDTFFRTVSFAVTNGHGPNEYIFEIFPQGTSSIVRNLDMRQYVQNLERRIKVDILNNISRGNQIPFKISCHSDLAGETVVDISLGNDPVERYVAPTFADSLFSPVITRNQELSNEIANGITWLVRSVIDGEASPQAPKIDLSQVYTPYQHPVAPAAQFNPQAYNTGATNNVADLGLL